MRQVNKAWIWHRSDAYQAVQSKKIMKLNNKYWEFQ